MATTYTWTYADTETINGSYIIDNNNVTVRATGRNITITPPASTISLKSNVSGTVKYLVQPRRLTYTKDDGSSAYKNVGSEFLSASVAQGTKVAFPSSSVTLYADDLFSEENPTEAYKDCQLKFPSSTSIIGTTLVHTDSGIERSGGPQNQITVGTIRVLLDVPPTATVSTLSFDTPYIYTGLTTASVIVSDTAAYYGGTIADVTLTIGNQSDSISGDGTLSIALDTAGTFTPTVTVTDSRGQTYTETLTPITVNTYTAPTVSFTAERTTSAGVPDDEGTYATCPSTFVFADAIATAVAPSVVLTDENGTQTTPTVTWYSSRAADGTLSGSVTWSSLSSGDTVYGLIPGLNPNYSYQISIRPRDSEGTGTAIVQTVSSAFYTVDFLAGGHGIAFGQPASQTGFWCDMDTHLLQGANVTGDVVISGTTETLNAYLDLPDYQTADTTDKAIYDAVVALGWDSDVLVN